MGPRASASDVIRGSHLETHENSAALAQWTNWSGVSKMLYVFCPPKEWKWTM